MRSWSFREGETIGAGRTALRLLGGGRRYEAWLAWDERLRALVVAKLLRPHLVDDPGALRSLRAEASMLERLGHPLLVRSFGAQPGGEHPQLVLEFIEGPRLSTLIRRDGLIFEQVLPLALSLCSVLHFLEAERVVHLDVKPRNLIMAGPPRVIDLSVARSLEDVARIRSHVGTDAYMAPEQCDLERVGEIGPASDVWGLGVTVHEALTGRLPYPRRVDGEPHPQLSWTPGELEGVPAALAPLLSSCLEPRPGDRLAADELADALEPLVDALPAPRLGRFRPGGKGMLERLERG
jgi:serine/threonine protein kinase